MLYSSKMVKKQSEAFLRFCGILLHIVLLTCPHVPIAFLKFTICDNQALIGCIPITGVAGDLNLKS